MKKDPMIAEDALRMLSEGNKRFVECRPENPNRDHERRVITSSEGQDPFAAVLACSDSRVPVSTLFDRGVGDIFTIRVAGNVVGDSETGSIEYAVQHLGIKLLVVLGHSSCGAVQAALGEGDHSLSVSKLIGKIKPAVNKVIAENVNLSGNELADATARKNVWHQVEDLFNNNEIVRTAAQENRLLVMAAFYDIATGEVEWMGRYPSRNPILPKTVAQNGSQSELVTNL